MANFAKETRGTKVYKDLDISFLPNPATGDLRVKTGDAAIKQSIKTLVLTDLSVRPYEDGFGTTIYTSLFENANNFTLGVLKDRLIEIIKTNEPRVLAETIDMSFSDSDQILDITIRYAIVNGQYDSVNISFRKIR